MTEPEIQIPRSLADVDLRRVPVLFSDVLVVGSGAAGISAAVEAAERGSVALVAKGYLSKTNTEWAQGGVAAPLGPDDSPERHAEDTLAAGAGLSEEAVVRRVTTGARSAIERLRSWGAKFEEAEGRLALLREGGHGRARIVHSGDRTGLEIERALIDRARRAERIETLERTFVLDLVRNDDGRCGGALAWSEGSGFLLLAAGATVLATGGAGQLYRETTNPEIATGDGLALAFRAGARLRDLEFVQFHPTLLYIAGAARVLISEVVRGAGAVLRDRGGVAFMKEVHPDAELAPRDVVSRAIQRRMVETGDTHVFLDLRGVPDAPRRFPGLAAVCGDFDLDLARDPIPVRPGAHYWVGGIAVDADGRADVPGLFACGEVASSGLHGANRLGSNSLLEGLVLGRAAGAAAAEERTAPKRPEPDLRVPGRRTPTSGADLNETDLLYSMKSLLGRLVGVERTEEGLVETRQMLRFWSRYALTRSFAGPRGWELANMLTVANLLTESALARRESRGVHFREDHPQPDDARWRRHLDVLPKPVRTGWVAPEIAAGPIPNRGSAG
ncbi:MAG TPA: L-aspartate oxidase [Planctomycetota bacterium]|jgi:L-aspartate oxidase|nr:L-aspartate oxidase [Planctomycetota bacterium]